jgi:hypothetical protein
MAEAWGNAEFDRPEPYEPLARAAAWHDEGWRAWEEAPEVSGDGAPVDFVDLDRERHIALYREGIHRAVAADPSAGLLVSMHGQGLYEHRRGLNGPPPPRAERPAAVQEFLEEQDELQRGIETVLGGESVAAWAWAGYRVLQAWDLLSLYLIWRGLPDARRGVLAQVPRTLDDAGLDLVLTPVGPNSAACDPWPFAGPEVELPVAARVIPDRAYEDNDDLRVALDDASWEQRPYTVVSP